MKHGPENYFLKDSGGVSRVAGALFSGGAIRSVIERMKAAKSRSRWAKTDYHKPDEPSADDAPSRDVMSCPYDEAPRRVFCRLFDKGAQPNSVGLIELGLAMTTETFENMNMVGGDANVPGGYTYLGQFIDHDITATPKEMKLTPDGKVDPERFFNERTPGLELDSLYGSGPYDSPELYQDDRIRLKVGRTSATPDGAPGGPIPGDGPHDLPRQNNEDPTARPTAIIGDGRNDENLAVAQTHLAFIQFHNAMADKIEAQRGLSGRELFEAARDEVTLHYQSIVLTDFLPRLIEQGVLQDVLRNGRKFYTDAMADCMPIEFSVAAFRLGHSMIRPHYEWNRVFNSNPGGIPARFELLFEFSGVSGTRDPNPDADPPFAGLPTLPSNWVVDWTRLYDFSGVSGVATHPDLNLIRELDANMAMALTTLPEFQRDPEVAAMPEAERTVLFSLAARNLLRGRLVELPSGQQVARAMQDAGIDFVPITYEEISAGPHQDILRANGLEYQTPLWYYILREAKIRHDGNALGPVGSRILAETFVGLIEHSRVNVLNQRPGLTFSMPELLVQAGNLNPLGD